VARDPVQARFSPLMEANTIPDGKQHLF